MRLSFYTAVVANCVFGILGLGLKQARAAVYRCGHSISA